MFTYAKGEQLAAATSTISQKEGGQLSGLLYLDIGYIYRGLNAEIPDSGVTLKFGYRLAVDMMFIYSTKKNDGSTYAAVQNSSYTPFRSDITHGPYISFIKSF